MARQPALAEQASDPTNGPDSLEGSESRDTISLLRGNDTYSGLGGSDLIYGNVGRDLIYGNDGRDTVFGGQNADTVYGGGDADKLYGNLGDDRLFGERGNDIVYGNEGRDQLFGGDGRDTLYGGQDDDILEGGAGDDSIVGGRGDDTAVFSGTRASYTITKNRDGSFTLDGASGRDHVETVENFRFDDGTFDANTLLTGNPSSGGGGTPVPPEDQAPVSNLDLKIIDSSDIPEGGTTLLNVLLNDDDPEDLPLAVNDSFNFMASSDGAYIDVLTGPKNADGSRQFVFNNNATNYDVTVERDGDVRLLTSGLPISDNIKFSFDYTAIDNGGNESNTASVQITITDDSNPQVAGIA